MAQVEINERSSAADIDAWGRKLLGIDAFLALRRSSTKLHSFQAKSLLIQKVREHTSQQARSTTWQDEDEEEDGGGSHHHDDSDVAALTSRVTLLNLDYTNRQDPLKEFEALRAHVHRTVTALGVPEAAQLVTLSEVDSASHARTLGQDLAADGFRYHAAKLAYDQIVTLFPEAWTADRDIVVSHEGKFQALKLTAPDNSRMLHVSVHLPHKNKREAAFRALASCIEDQASDCDSVVVSGDFNAKPTDPLVAHLPRDLTFAIPDGMATTNTGTTKDNVATTNTILDITVRDDLRTHYTHFPVGVSTARR